MTVTTDYWLLTGHKLQWNGQYPKNNTNRRVYVQQIEAKQRQPTRTSLARRPVSAEIVLCHVQKNSYYHFTYSVLDNI